MLTFVDKIIHNWHVIGTLEENEKLTAPKADGVLQRHPQSAWRYFERKVYGYNGEETSTAIENLIEQTRSIIDSFLDSKTLSLFRQYRIDQESKSYSQYDQKKKTAENLNEKLKKSKVGLAKLIDTYNKESQLHTVSKLQTSVALIEDEIARLSDFLKKLTTAEDSKRGTEALFVPIPKKTEKTQKKETGFSGSS